MSTSVLISAVDSYYSYVRQQLLLMNAQVTLNGATIAQPVGSVVSARDWPLTAPVEGALYLLLSSVQPLEGGSPSQTHYQYICQWMWLLIGRDIQDTQRAQNRGDRHRAMLQIASNLRQANFPGWCQKLEYSANPVTGALSTEPVESVYPLSTVEMVRWDPIRFVQQPDNTASGLDYGIGAVNLYTWEDVNPALLA